MNNHQLLNALTTNPQHSIHRVQMSNIFARWLTMTSQPPTVAGLTFTQYRELLLDALYADWERFRAEEILTYGPPVPIE